jgi:AraC-like DNA-binding protein
LNSRWYAYSFIELDQSFHKLASLLESEVTGNTITIPGKNGQGTIKKFRAANGLYITTWDIELRHALHLERVAQHDSNKNSFTLFHIFTKNHPVISMPPALINSGEASKNTVFLSGAANLAMRIDASSPAKMVEIAISEEWLAGEYAPKNMNSYAFYTILLNQKESVLFTEQASLNTYHSILDLYNHINKSEPDTAYARAKIHSLLYGIFTSADKRQDPVYKKNLQTEEKIIALETIMEDHLDKNLPSISSIARILAVSESTLKRNFKALYGTSIYEYYLHKKMQKAKQLLEENSVTVKEVAYKLGYEKVSNFITIFKKHHEFSPGHLKKKQTTQVDDNSRLTTQ